MSLTGMSDNVLVGGLEHLALERSPLNCCPCSEGQVESEFYVVINRPPDAVQTGLKICL